MSTSEPSQRWVALAGVPLVGAGAEGGPAPAVVYHTGALPGALAPLAAGAEVEFAAVAGVADVPSAVERPAVLVVRAADAGEMDALRALPDAAVVVAADAGAEAGLRACGRVLLALPGDPAAAAGALRAALEVSAGRLAQQRMAAELARARAELRELSEVSMALTTERDPDRLLRTILRKAMHLTGSDAASLYLVERDGDGPARLRFRVARTDSLPEVQLQSHVLPLDTGSLAGYAAATGQTLRIADAYDLPAEAPYALNRSFDARFGYRTRSMLVVPLVDHPGATVGVLQLINRKVDPAARIDGEAAAARWVVPYTDGDLALTQALAGQAAVSIENSLLYRQIEHLFESFVKAAVIAVDQRDPATSGHSVRVAALTCDVASALERAGTGAHAGVRFTPQQMRELRYAALLHDFGKVGVREEVLVKPKKLPALLLERVQARFALARRTIEAEHHRARADALEGGRRGELAALERVHAARLAELERMQALVAAANEPTVLPREAARELDDLARTSFTGPDGAPHPYVTDEELAYLRILRGSLSDDERREIESHVEQTYRFLVQIPWTGDLCNVAEIAYGHHEKLNGRGYPRGLGADDIPLQTRIMTVADIFDALTASDRPYKRALPAGRALEILRMEAGEGLLDAGIVEVLVESGVYRMILETDWRDL